MSTFYAVFQNPAKARLALMDLLNQGVPTDDISLVSRGDGAAFGKSLAMDDSVKPLSDASYFVGGPDDPVRDEQFPNAHDTELKYAAVESPIGGGIASDQADDAIASLDESDDSQSLAEDEMDDEASLSTQAERELRDLDLAVTTGFPNKPEPLERTPRSMVYPVEDLERSLEVIDVPGFGVVVGSGPLATAALDYGDGDSAGDGNEIMRYLREEGIPDAAVKDYMAALEEGKAILAVGLVPGEVESPVVEAVADKFGATSSATFDAPRY